MLAKYMCIYHNLNYYTLFDINCVLIEMLRMVNKTFNILSALGYTFKDISSDCQVLFDILAGIGRSYSVDLFS